MPSLILTQGSEVGAERRCTSASAAGESEYESVDEGEDSPKDASLSKSPVDASPQDGTEAVDRLIESTSRSSSGNGQSTPDPPVVEASVTLGKMC